MNALLATLVTDALGEAVPHYAGTVARVSLALIGIVSVITSAGLLSL